MNNITTSILLAVIAIGLSAIPALAETEILSPFKQYSSGIPINEIQCNGSKILMESPRNTPACVTENSVDRLLQIGFNVIAITVDSTNMDVEEPDSTNMDVEEPDSTNVKLTVDNVNDEPQITVLNVASPVEFVDDGREYKGVLQRGPGPRPIFDKIMGYDLVIGNNDVSGLASISSPPHEKYSKNQGVGLYIEDWMPTYILDGYKLLYAYSNNYQLQRNYDPNSAYEVHSVGYRFVPSDFILYPNVTDTSLYRQSNGYGIVVKIADVPWNSQEDIAESLWESRSSQRGNYGELREMTRDGKFVSAYAGGNDLNYYIANVAFAPDEYTILYVNSYYHTLDELIPVFESVMK